MQSIKLVFATALLQIYVSNVSWGLSAAAVKVVTQMWIKDSKSKILISAVTLFFICFSSCVCVYDQSISY